MGIEGIEIAKLSGKLQQLATVADDGNGVIEGQEIAVFDAYAKAAVEKGQVSEDDYKAIFGSEITTTAPQSPATATNPQTKSHSKKDTKRMESYVKTILKEESIQVTDPSKLLARLKERLGVSADDPKYKDLQNRVAHILDAINKIGYKSKDDVNKLEKKVKDKLKIGKKDDFAKDVLELLVKNAETVQRAKEYGEIKAAYETLTDAGMDEEAAYQQVRKEFKDKGSYYGDYLKHGSLAYKMLHFKRKDSKFEKQTIMPDARKTTRKAISQSDATTSNGVKKDAKAKLETSRDYNRYTKRALNGENNFGAWISGQDSDMKVARKNRATQNVVEDIREDGLTEKEIHKSVDKRSTFGSKMTFGLLFKKKTQLFEALKASGLIAEKENGEYDVSQLSMIIGEHVGANYKLDRQSSEFKALAEITKTTSALAAATELENLSEEEARMLVEMCGYKVEGKNWGKAILGATVGALVNGLSAGASVATNPRAVLDRTITNKNHVEVNINCETDVAQDIKNDFADMEGATVTLTNFGIQILIDQKNVVPLFWKTSRHIVKTALKAAVPGAALGLLAGLKDSPEKPITSTQFNCTTLEEYEKVLNSEVKQRAIDPKYKEALMMIAASFIKEDSNGNKAWDCEGYKMFLNKAAGNGGILNREELIGALEDLEKEKPVPVKEEDHDEEEDDDEVPIEGGQSKKCPLEQNSNPVDTTLTHKIKFGDSWEELVNAYFPAWKDCFGKMYGKGGAIQALKQAVAQNPQEYQKLLAGYIPSSINIPETLGDCKRNDNGQVAFRQPTGAPKGYMASVGMKTGYNEVTLTDCNGNNGKGRDVGSALQDLNTKTGKQYTEDDIVK